MKKILSLLSVFILAVVLTACDKRPVLKVFMPTEYISEDLLKAFNKDSEFKVDIITFDSNEDMLSKYSSGTYDIIIPSDYALEELVSKKDLHEIDWTKLTSFNKSDIDSELMAAINMLNESETSFDLLKYGVPYFWGNVGILFDTTKVSREVIESNGWNIFKSGRDLMFYDSARDGIMIALKQYFADNNITNGTINNPSKEALAQAESWLISIKGGKTLIGTDQVFDLMANPSQIDLSVAYSGDAVYMMDENENLDFYVPTTGSNIFIDALVIPKTAKNIDYAYTFIDFLLSKESAYQNSVDTAYTSPRGDVINMIIEEGIYQSSSYRVVFGQNDELFRYNANLSSQIIDIWQRVLAS